MTWYFVFVMFLVVCPCYVTCCYWWKNIWHVMDTCGWKIFIWESIYEICERVKSIINAMSPNKTKKHVHVMFVIFLWMPMFYSISTCHSCHLLLWFHVFINRQSTCKFQVKHVKTRDTAQSQWLTYFMILGFWGFSWVLPHVIMHVHAVPMKCSCCFRIFICHAKG